MKLIQSTLIATTLLFGNVAHAQSTFADVPDNHWAAAAVKTLAEAGIVEGFPEPADNGVKVGAAASERVAEGAPKKPAAKKTAAREAAGVVTPKVKSALVANAALKNTRIDVTTMDCCGTVSLDGKVSTAAQKQLAGAIAQKTARNYKIINHLEVAPTKTAHIR